MVFHMEGSYETSVDAPALDKGKRCIIEHQIALFGGTSLGREKKMILGLNSQVYRMSPLGYQFSQTKWSLYMPDSGVGGAPDQKPRRGHQLASCFANHFTEHIESRRSPKTTHGTALSRSSRHLSIQGRF